MHSQPPAAEMALDRMYSQPADDHHRESSYPPPSMNARNAPHVTIAVSITNASTSTWWAGRSLSSAHGSVEVPMVNGPAGTSTSAFQDRCDARGGGVSASTG